MAFLGFFERRNNLAPRGTRPETQVSERTDAIVNDKFARRTTVADSARPTSYVEPVIDTTSNTTERVFPPTLEDESPTETLGFWKGLGSKMKQKAIEVKTYMDDRYNHVTGRSTYQLPYKLEPPAFKAAQEKKERFAADQAIMQKYIDVAANKFAKDAEGYEQTYQSARVQHGEIWKRLDVEVQDLIGSDANQSIAAIWNQIKMANASMWTIVADAQAAYRANPLEGEELAEHVAGVNAVLAQRKAEITYYADLLRQLKEKT